MSAPAERTTEEWAALCETQERRIELLESYLATASDMDMFKEVVSEAERARNSWRRRLEFVVKAFEAQHELVLAQLDASQAVIRRYKCALGDVRELLDGVL